MHASKKQTTSIIIAAQEWLELQQHISGKRKKFLTQFTNLLSLRLQKEGIKSALRFNF